MVKASYVTVVLALTPMLIASVGFAPFTDAYGANKNVCGLQMCSDIEGGYDAWIAQSVDDSSSQGDTFMDIASISIPLHKGYYDGQSVYYIITDASEPVHVEVISKSQGWDVMYAPSLAETPADERSTTYMFTNGIRGSGVHGFQSEVFTSTYAHTDKYSPLTGHVHVTWANNTIPKILDSEKSILDAAKKGDLLLTELDVVINMPRFVVSPAQSEMLDRMKERMLVVPLHYGFYNGDKVHGLVLDSSDKTHADLISLLQGFDSVYAPSLEASNSTIHTSNAYFFTNGIEGPGVHGYQRQVYTSMPGDDAYSPISSHIHVTWMSDSAPELLMSESSILQAADAGNVILTQIPIAINMPMLLLDSAQIAALPDNFVPSNYNGSSDESADVPRADSGDSTMADDVDDARAADGGTADGIPAESSDSDVAMPGGMADETDTARMSDEKPAAPELRLARASVAVDIPLHKGYYDGQDVYYIITDSSDPVHADIISSNQGWTVELAPFLSYASDDALATAYMFTNGIDGSGVHGFQSEVFTSTPGQPDTYSALTAHMHVTWSDDATPRILDSESAILGAASSGEVTLDDIDVILNMPQMVWPGGQMMVKDDVSVTDKTPYGGGQVLDIDTGDMTVTFVAHRGWGPDGRTAYYIVTDATPSGPAGMMGVVTADTSASLIANAAAVDLYQFANGIPGPGPLGFQPGIASSALGDPGYSPMWRIYLIEWKDPADAQLLQTIDDIQAYLDAGLLTVTLARPMNTDHIVNCPFIDPFQ